MRKQTDKQTQQWEEVMGHSVWEWLLPIGDTKQKGLDYRPNPRFDAWWRKRREWPADLRSWGELRRTLVDLTQVDFDCTCNIYFTLSVPD